MDVLLISNMMIDKVDIFLEQREVAFLSPSKVCENLNFSTVHPEKFKFLQILLGDKNATYLCSKIISTLSYKLFWLVIRTTEQLSIL